MVSRVCADDATRGSASVRGIGPLCMPGNALSRCWTGYLAASMAAIQRRAHYSHTASMMEYQERWGITSSETVPLHLSLRRNCHQESKLLATRQYCTDMLCFKVRLLDSLKWAFHKWTLEHIARLRAPVSSDPTCWSYSRFCHGSTINCWNPNSDNRMSYSNTSTIFQGWKLKTKGKTTTFKRYCCNIKLTTDLP